MKNDLYLGPAVDVVHSNPLGAAAANMLHGAPALGHEKKINIADYSALMACHIIFNDDTVGLFIYDANDGAYVHHQFINSRVERCLLAHAYEISTQISAHSHSVAHINNSDEIKNSEQLHSSMPRYPDSVLENILKPSNVAPEVLLSSALAHLTASQRFYVKLKAIRKSATPVYATRSHLSDLIVITQFKPRHDNDYDDDKERVERSENFIAWLHNKDDNDIAQLIEGCDLHDRPKILKGFFETPERLTHEYLRVLDNFDSFFTELAEQYAIQLAVPVSLAKTQLSHPKVRHIIDHGLIHQQNAVDMVESVRAIRFT